jgi:hypothetical protein
MTTNKRFILDDNDYICPSSNGLRQLAARFKGGCGSSEG